MAANRAPVYNATDKDIKFAGKSSNSLCIFLWLKHLTTTSCHHLMISQAEMCNRTLKANVICYRARGPNSNVIGISRAAIFKHMHYRGQSQSTTYRTQFAAVKTSFWPHNLESSITTTDRQYTRRGPSVIKSSCFISSF